VEKHFLDLYIIALSLPVAVRCTLQASYANADGSGAIDAVAKLRSVNLK
jgi:hypothetical protein